MLLSFNEYTTNLHCFSTSFFLYVACISLLKFVKRSVSVWYNQPKDRMECRTYIYKVELGKCWKYNRVNRWKQTIALKMNMFAHSMKKSRGQGKMIIACWYRSNLDLNREKKLSDNWWWMTRLSKNSSCSCVNNNMIIYCICYVCHLIIVDQNDSKVTLNWCWIITEIIVQLARVFFSWKKIKVYESVFIEICLF
jgi:hypothetical protein